MASSSDQNLMKDTGFLENDETSYTSEAGKKKNKIILALGGAFNPVHTRHVMAMVEAKTWLEENTEHEVIAGRLAVAPDGYVKSKAKRHGYKCMKAEHRIKLCQIACKEHSTWLQPYGKPIGSAEDCAKKTKLEFEMSKSQESVRIGIIVGADRAVSGTRDPKWRKSTDNIHICVGRRGETEKVSTLYSSDKESNRVNSEFYFIPKELDDVSSTRVRLRLQEITDEDDSIDGKEKVLDSLVDVDWINRGEANYISENWSDLYLL